VLQSNQVHVDPVVIFVDAVANEMNRDRYVFLKFPVSRHTKLVIPRLEKLAYLAKNFPRSLACIAQLSSGLWCLFLYPIFLLLQVASTLLQIRMGSNSFKGDVFFVTSKTSLLFSKSSGFKGVIIYLSKKLERSSPQSNSLGGIADYVVLTDIAVAILYSVRALRQLNGAFYVPGAVFQVYAAFWWFLTWSVLNRSAVELTSLWFSNDSDRWAVLLDRLPTTAQKIIVQHGLLCDPPSHVGFRNPSSLPTRLMNIDKIVLFDKESEYKYRDLVLSHDCSSSFTHSDGWLINKMPDQDDRSAVRVLMIGQRAHLKQECELANDLAEKLIDSRIYVRPHPGFSVEHYKQRLNSRVLLVDDFFYFPYAEICICFDFSSLAYYYEKQGSHVIYFTDSNKDLETKEKMMNKINLILKYDNKILN
jgi:hypothetical protein